MFNNFLKRVFVRNLEVDNLLESFFISAVGAMLTLRFLLYLLDYPQFGGRSLHIAHMLWGGLLMLLAQIFLFTFITKPSQKTASIIGGIGFGIFIDELGKFITRDNNYFFQPTISLIYVVFVILFLTFRKIGRTSSASKTEYLINAIEISKEAILNDLDQNEKEKALYYLEESGQKDNLSQAFKEVFFEEKLVALRPNPMTKVVRRMQNFYLSIAAKDWFIKGLTAFFIIQSLFLIANAILVGKSFLFPTLVSISLPQKLEILSSTIAIGFVIAGILKLRRGKRLAAYFDFKKSLLISIFLTQVFAFYDLQLVALTELALNIVILVALDHIIGLEKANIPFSS